MTLSLAACGEAPASESEVAEAADVEPVMPEPDQNGSYLFWTPEEQLVGYKNIERIFSTLTVKRGETVAQLPVADAPLEVSYKAGEETWDTARFMAESMTTGVLVLHGGEIVLEAYAHGRDADDRWTSFSVGKSISSTLAGAALKDGAIRSLDDAVTEYLPGLAGSGYDGVTVRHLLNMSSGVAWNETYDDPNSDVGRIRSSRTEDGSDPIVAYMSKLPREAEPGTQWKYKTGETHLVGSLVRAATGKTLANYLSEKIWAPYGMEQDAEWMLDTEGGEYAGCCISATLRDFGRFGLFFMNGAKIDGVSIVPDGWVEEATSPTQVSIDTGPGYGYQWWVAEEPGAYRAVGIFGQMIYFDPGRDLIVVTQGAWPTATDRTASAMRSTYLEAVIDAIDAEG